jgi:archaetidylinositol phosphate synthase
MRLIDMLMCLWYKRDYSGLLGRADRLMLLILFPIIQHMVHGFSFELPFHLTIIELVLAYFAIVGNITALQRFYITLRWFRRSSRERK